MEYWYSKQLIEHPDWPCGKIEEIIKLGLFQRKDKPFVKGSVGCVIGIIENEERRLDAMEYKCRSASHLAHAEEERVGELRRKGIMSRDHFL